MSETVLKLPRSEKAETLKAMSVSDLPDYRLMGVYYIQNTASEKFYVGSSQDVFARVGSHFNMLVKGEHHNVHLQRAYTKHGGDAFVWGVCEEVFDVDLLLGVEQEWIDAIGDYNICREAGSTRGVAVSEAARKKMSDRNSGSGNPMYGKKRPDIAELMKELKTGITLSEEHKQKMSESLKGSKGPWAYPEIAAKLRESLKGKNLGRKHSEETRAKISAAVSGRKASEETKEKLRVAATGRTHTQETKEALSRMKKGVPINITEADRKRRSESGATIRQRMSDEQKKEVAEKVASTKRGVPLTEEHKAKLSAATKGRPLSESHKQALRESAAKRPPLTDEQKKARAEAAKRALAARTPEEVDQWKAKISSSRRGKPLSDEHKAAIKSSQEALSPEAKAAKEAKRQATIAAKKAR